MYDREFNSNASEPLDIKDIGLCSCGVLVVVFRWAKGDQTIWDPNWLQRRWIRSLLPRFAIAKRGFGYGLGEVHRCCPKGYRPVDAIATMKAEDRKAKRGMGLAGDGTEEGPVERHGRGEC